MPSLTRNPDDELIRRLVALESRVRGLETQRSRPSVAACAQFRGSQTLAANTFVGLDIQTVVFDTAGLVSLTADTLTVPHPGSYMVVIMSAASGVGMAFGGSHVVLNGSRVFTMNTPAVSGYASACLTSALSLDAGDVISAEYRPDGATAALVAGSFILVTRLSD